MITPDTRNIAAQRFAELELRLSFGRYVEICDEFMSSPVEHRLADVHAAFADADVKAVLSVIGGYNSNQLLPHLDWDLIAANPKIFCGYSDVTALTCGIWAKTGLITYAGPHYSTFGMQQHFDQTMQWFRAAVMTEGWIAVEAAKTWSDDAWYFDQEHRRIEPNDGHWVMADGIAEGPLVGGNLCTLNLLQGTEFMPELDGAIVFIEDDVESRPHTFDRDLTSLTQLPRFVGVKGILIGRFQRAVEMTRPMLASILHRNPRLRGLPIVANVDFGHTDPLMTLPVGGTARLEATGDVARLEIR